jgi:signal transduction histidine kinase
LKTPLTSIQGFTQALLDNVIQTPQEVRQALQLIQTESNRMSRLVQDLVALARLESGSEVEFSQMNLTDLLQHLVEKFQIQARSAGVELIYPKSDLPLISGDADRLAQVFSNLLDNAIKYTPAGGKIVLSTVNQGTGVSIRVSDSGAGISDADKKRIFERFYRSERTRKASDGNSAGLGLAITRQIVLLHKGTISVTDNFPKGSIFIVTLPVAASK